MRYILPKLMALLTFHDRYIPIVDWSKDSWTHNIFRVYELTFGRRVGIRRESVSFIDTVTGEDLQFTFTFEASLALFESEVRAFLKSFKLVKFKLYVPALVGVENCPKFPSPYLFAIARESAGTTITATGLSTSITRAHTTSGSDRYLLASCEIANTTGDNITNVTYNNVTFFSNNLGKPLFTTDGNARTYLFYQIAPSSGSSFNCVFTCSSSSVFRAYTASYTGVDQTTPTDASNTNNTDTTSGVEVSTTVTVTASNCWAHMVTANNALTPVAGTNATWLTTGTSTGYGVFDSNGTIGTGSFSMGWSIAASTGQGTVLVAFKPVATTTIKTWNGIVRANLKTLNGTASASIKTINGIT